MPLKLTKKAVPSNKNQTLPDNQLQKAQGSPPTAIKANGAPTPFIDKISIIVVPANEQDAHDIHENIWDQFKDLDAFKDVNGGKLKEFKVAKKVVLKSVPDLKKCPLFQYAYSGGKASKLRLEFVPVDLGHQGLVELHSSLASVVPNGWDYVIHRGHITRLDVAVDFPEVSMDDFHFLPLQGATTKQWRVDGKLQGYSHGKPKGNHTEIYDRKEKRKAKGKSWQGKEGVRIERRIKDPPIHKLTDLPSLPNPFAAMKLVSMPSKPPTEKKPFIWDLFRRAADAEGLAGALALLPEERRTLYRKHLAAHQQPWWDPAAIWEGWPTMLATLQIGTASAWL